MKKALKIIGDARRIILGAVVHDENLHLVSPGQQRFDGVGHIGLGIIAWDGNGQKLHCKSSPNFNLFR